MAVYAPISKFFFPTDSVAFLMIGNSYVEVLGVGCVDQCTVTDLPGELEDLGALCADVDRNTLLLVRGG